MFVYFLLIKIGFLAIVCSAFGTVNGNGFATYQIGIFQKRNKQFEKFLQGKGIVFSKVGDAVVIEANTFYEPLHFDVSEGFSF
jgi:hypothetical protein